MAIDRDLVSRVFASEKADGLIPRSSLDEARLEERYLAEFVAESESMEGYQSSATEVLDGVRDLVMA